MTCADPFQIVLNWSEGVSAQVECVTTAALVRETRRVHVPDMDALARMSVLVDELEAL